MTDRASAASTGKYDTVESLIRYASEVFTVNGVGYSPAKMSKLIRSEIRSSRTGADIRHLVDVFVAREMVDLDWRGFELFVNGYADPTGARAAHNVDRERGKA